MSVCFPISLEEVSRLLSLDSTEIDELCEQRLVIADFAGNNADRSQWRLSPRNLFELALTYSLTHFDKPVEFIRVSVRSMGAVERMLKDVISDFSIPASLVPEDAPVLISHFVRATN